MINKLKQKLVVWLFARWFAGYNFPFEKLDQKIMNMEPGKQNAFFQSAQNVLNEKAFKEVMQEGMRKLYEKLTLSTQSAIDQTAYRLTMSWARDLENAFKEKARLHRTPSATDLSKQLN
jgi:hypothetical protein